MAWLINRDKNKNNAPAYIFFFFNRDPLSRVREIQMSSQNIQGQTAAVLLWEGWAPRPRGKKES